MNAIDPTMARAANRDAPDFTLGCCLLLGLILLNNAIVVGDS